MRNIGSKAKFWVSALFSLVLLVSTGILFYRDFIRKNETDVNENRDFVTRTFVFEPDEEWVDDELCTTIQNIEYVYYSHSDPLWEPNNKFGLYIYAEEKDFFEIAQKLVNSNGGEWGYVLIPFNVRDHDEKKWARVFDQLINKRLIPVIQLWNVDVADYQGETREAAEFLNKFVWPIKFRYISVYNEPNDNKFWYNRADAAEYARILDYTVRIFKEVNQDFYMLNAAFNVSASSDGESTDSFLFMKKMDEAVPGIFERIDGWASHPYPQPNFSGSPYDEGRWSIRAYEDELNFLREELGVEKDLPVFITETGWAHAEGVMYNSSYLPVTKIAEYFEIAFEEVWLKDDRVRAVMPFTIRYDPPFDHFSWVNSDKVPYYHYDVVKKLEKVEGEPPIISTGNVDIYNCSE
jgi:hypothetical protein